MILGGIFDEYMVYSVGWIVRGDPSGFATTISHYRSSPIQSEPKRRVDKSTLFLAEDTRTAIK